MLPDKMLLQVLHFADYEILVLVKLAGRRFLRLVVKFAEELARRRGFKVTFKRNVIKFYDTTTGARRIRYKPGNQQSLADACRELVEVVGPHSVAKLKFYNNTWNMPDVCVVFDAAPPLKYAEKSGALQPATLQQRGLFRGLHEQLFRDKVAPPMGRLRRLSSVQLDIPPSGMRLRTSAHQSVLRVFNVKRVINSFVKELIWSVALQRLVGAEALEIDVSDSLSSGAFGLQMIEMLKNSRAQRGRAVILRMTTYQNDGELVLDESEYTVDVDDTTTRYASEKSGIVVEVKGPSITIQSTAEFPPAKRSRRNE